MTKTRKLRWSTDSELTEESKVFNSLFRAVEQELEKIAPSDPLPTQMIFHSFDAKGEKIGTQLVRIEDYQAAKDPEAAIRSAAKSSE